MRIAYLSSACIPSRTANSIHVMKVCQAFGRAGHHVKLFANQDRRLVVDVPGTFHDYYGVKKTFSLEYVRWPVFHGGSILYGYNVARRAIDWQPDWVYGRNLTGCFFCGLRGLPVVLELHKPVDPARPLATLALRWLTRMPSFRYLTVITHALRKHYEKIWPDLKGRILVAPDGADRIDDVQKTEHVNPAAKRLQIGYTGHLYKGKGVELIVELARLAPEYDFHLVGGNDEDLSRWVSQNVLPNNVVLHGHRPPREIPEYLLAFDIVLLPNQPVVYAHGGTENIGDWTSPLKLFEYMAAGRPIICSDVPVLMEVARDGENMLICSHDKAEQWINAIRMLEADQELREVLGKNAQKEFNELYSWDARVAYLTKEFLAVS